ncbi:MAG: 50S ribosome-binding GTPase [Phycisphaerales bacterium]|nr:50S ribosome-binding GTPase [Phycisphaerales bacterium]
MLRGGFHAGLRASWALQLPVYALRFPGPHSYTGEDSIEIQLPGNPILLERVIDALIDSADQRGIEARRAFPGEFTARAYLNGRISLTQAEGVAATIAAQSDAQLRAAQMLTGGRLGSFAHDLADDLASALALVEAGIDFTDQEDVIAIAPADLLDRLTNLKQRIDDQLNRSVGTEQLQTIPWVVLAGEPNAGKSALFNALLGRERAVVSPTAGTTRDALCEPLTISTAHGPAEVMLVDLAGLDDQDAAAINRAMQSAARQALDRAELILQCVPMNENQPPSIADNQVLVRTKSDLPPTLPTQHSASSGGGTQHSLAVSAFTGRNLEVLCQMIANRLADRAVSLAADALSLQPRHEAALRSAAVNLSAAIDLVAPIRADRSLGNPELLAASMRSALDDLSSLAGDITPDDILTRVFATFCIGK